MNRMSRFIYILWVLLIVSGCNKETATTGKYEGSPATAIPSALKEGVWFWGNFGPIAYYDQNGHEVGNETEAARQFTFDEVNGKGRVEFMQYLGLRNASNCVTEIYTLKKGTIVFEGTDKLTFYPVEGSFRTVKNGCSGNGTQSRPATSNDLAPEVYLWEIKIIEDEKLLYIYSADDVEKQNPLFVYQHAE